MELFNEIVKIENERIEMRKTFEALTTENNKKYTDFINKNRREIKQNIMPKKGKVYKTSVTERVSIWAGNMEYTKVDSDYILIKSNILYAEGASPMDGRLMPSVKVIYLDDNFEQLTDYESCMWLNEINISYGALSKKEPKETFVYVMIDKNTGLYKIGRSVKPEVREKTLQSEKPTIELMFSNKGLSSDEKNLHQHFSHQRIRGEWFNLNYMDLEYIKEYFK
jgi:hypothetical protein